MTAVAADASLANLTATVERSGLLGPSHLADFRAWCEGRSDATAADAVAWLIDQGWATRWQGQQLLAGHHSFFLRHYKLVGRLGGGGMGTVFQAIDDRDGRLVAVKVLRKSALERPSTLERFRREIAALGKLRHPNIVAAYEDGRLGPYHYLVMEYVDGRDVGHWIAKLKRLPIDLACEVARQAALGLDHAHRLGFIHRDVKPSNLIAVRRPGGALDVRVLDFGLARNFEGDAGEARVTRAGQIVGTVDYLAPEQAHGSKQVDGRADVYSLGVTLFEMLAGRTPFTGDSMMARLVARVMQPAPPLRDFLPDAPQPLVEAVAKALAFQPEERFATAGDFAAALAEVRASVTPKPDGTKLDATKLDAAQTEAVATADAIEAAAAGDAPTKAHTPDASMPGFDDFQQALGDKARSSGDSQLLALPTRANRRLYWLAAGIVALILIRVVAVLRG